MSETPSTTFRRPNPKRVVIKRWPFGFRVDPGQLKLDTAYDPPQVEFVNRTGFPIELIFDPSLFVRPTSGGTGASKASATDSGLILRMDPDPTRTLVLSLQEEAEGWYEYQVRVTVSGAGTEMTSIVIEATGGSRPGIEIRR